jgi:sugar phosphate isomerase/epimerase
MYSRREFGQMVMAGLPLSLMLGRINPTVSGVRIGAITYSFNDMPNVAGQDHVDMVIADCQASGVGLIELMCNHVEPMTEYQMQQAAARAARLAAAAAAAAPGSAPGPGAAGAAPAAAATPGATPARGGGGGRGQQSPEALKAREDLRQWRLSTPMSHFAGIKKKFDDAGITIFAYCVNGMGDDWTSEEIDTMFTQAQTLGASTISSSTTLSVAQNLVPFVEKHKYPIAFHNHANLTDPNQFATPESFAKALAMSKYFKLNLDIGHFTQASFDAVSYLQEHHADISHLHVKDVKRDGGPILPWGEADTPIKAVLQLLKQTNWPIPAEVEMEYKVPAGSSCVEEVKKCMAIMKADLA